MSNQSRASLLLDRFQEVNAKTSTSFIQYIIIITKMLSTVIRL